MPANNAQDASPTWSLRQILIAGLWLAAGGLLLFTLLGFAARWHFRFEQLCHFRLQYFLIGIVLIGLSALWRRWRLLLVAAIGVAINGAVIYPIFLPAVPPEQTQGP